MRRKAAICVLAAAVCILLGCVYSLFFGKSGLLNSERRTVSGRSLENAESTVTGENPAETEAGEDAAGNGFGPVVRGFVRLPGRFYLALPKETALCGVSG